MVCRIYTSVLYPVNRRCLSIYDPWYHETQAIYAVHQFWWSPRKVLIPFKYQPDSEFTELRICFWVRLSRERGAEIDICIARIGLRLSFPKWLCLTRSKRYFAKNQTDCARACRHCPCTQRDSPAPRSILSLTLCVLNTIEPSILNCWRHWRSTVVISSFVICRGTFVDHLTVWELTIRSRCYTHRIACASPSPRLLTPGLVPLMIMHFVFARVTRRWTLLFTHAALYSYWRWRRLIRGFCRAVIRVVICWTLLSQIYADSSNPTDPL